MSITAKQVLCPYCGHLQAGGRARCEDCGGFLDAASVRISLHQMGPWFIRHRDTPHLPGCTYQMLEQLIRQGRIGSESIIRGPTTRQLWTLARRAPGVAHLVGYCYMCGGAVESDAASCTYCWTAFQEPADRNDLGLSAYEPDRPPAWALAQSRAASANRPSTAHQSSGSVVAGRRSVDHAAAALAGLASPDVRAGADSIFQEGLTVDALSAPSTWAPAAAARAEVRDALPPPDRRRIAAPPRRPWIRIRPGAIGTILAAGGILAAAVLSIGLLTRQNVESTDRLLVMGLCAAVTLIGALAHRAGTMWGALAVMAGTMGVTGVSISHMVAASASPQVIAQRMIARERQYLAAATHALGRRLAAAMPGAKVMVILPPRFSPDYDQRQAMLEGLERGLADGAQIVTKLDPPPAQPVASIVGDAQQFDDDLADGLPDASLWLTRAYFDRLIAEHGGGCDLVVSMMGLPDDFDRSAYARPDARPRIAITEARTEAQKQWARSGLIAAAYGLRKDAQYDAQPPPADPEQAFAKRWELLAAP